MIKLDAAYLKSVGLDLLRPDEADVVIAHVYETLEFQVGQALVRQMTIPQIDEFEALVDAGAEDKALEWLEANFPNYRDVVNREFEIVTAELRQAAPLMLALIGHAS